MAARIYVVEDKINGTVALVKATGAVSAIKHIAEDQYDAHVAKADEVAQYMSAGAVVQDATADGSPEHPATT